MPSAGRNVSQAGIALLGKYPSSCSPLASLPAGKFQPSCSLGLQFTLCAGVAGARWILVWGEETVG